MRALTPLLAFTMALTIAACAPSIPDATYVCATSEQCPPGLTCFGGLCVRDAGDAGVSATDAGPCTPVSDCGVLRAECGQIGDGCGGTVECGACDDTFDTCGLHIANICDCEATGCDAEACGAVDNGCGGLVECGACDGGQTCGDGSCACVPVVCGPLCGMIPDGCGLTLDCGNCAASEFCGGDGPNLCGATPCTPTTCAAEGKDCGEISDGCGLTLECGSCSGSGVTCGGGDAGSATPNVCGCTPQTCAGVSLRACENVTERCGTMLDCGVCILPGETCGGGGRMNICGCAPDPSEPNETEATADERGTLAVGDTSTLRGNTLHDASDTDWYVFELSDPVVSMDAPTTTIGVLLNELPGRGDYYVETLIDCAEGIAATTCPVGLPLGTNGCTSQGLPLLLPEATQIEVSCRATHVYVHVAQASSVRTCPPYLLSVARL